MSNGSTKAYEVIADRIIAALDGGTIRWRKPLGHLSRYQAPERRRKAIQRRQRPDTRVSPTRTRAGSRTARRESWAGTFARARRQRPSCS